MLDLLCDALRFGDWPGHLRTAWRLLTRQVGPDDQYRVVTQPHEAIPVCDEPFCFYVGFPCRRLDGTTAHYCEWHARQHGICPECYEFHDGEEAFEISKSGICDSCLEGMKYGRA